MNQTPAQDIHPVAVIGAGPVGLAAAAHLIDRAIPFVLLEAGDDVGSSIREWGHVQLFSPWRFDIDRIAERLLSATGWRAPDPDSHPTGDELVERYLEPLAALPQLAASLRTNRRVTSIAREGLDKVSTAGRETVPFVVTTDGPHGLETHRSWAVIDSTGIWATPNPLGASGVPAPGEMRAGDLIDTGVPDVLGRDARRYRGRRVAVVGAGHSAQHVVRDLGLLGSDDARTQVTWIVRGHDTERLFGGGVADQLPERGRLGDDARAAVAGGVARLVTGFRTREVVPDGGAVRLIGEDGRLLGPFDRVVTATGHRPDLSFLRDVRIDPDPALESTRALAPLIDPNVHSCGTVRPHGAKELAQPEPDLYVVGSKSYGRAPTFLLATGYEQVRSVVATIAGDHVAAAEVHLELPETGVCSLSAVGGPSSDACCG